MTKSGEERNNVFESNSKCHFSIIFLFIYKIKYVIINFVYITLFFEKRKTGKSTKELKMEIQQLSNQFVNELNQFCSVVDHLNEQEKRVENEKYVEKKSDSDEKKLKRQEGVFDRLFELF